MIFQKIQNSNTLDEIQSWIIKSKSFSSSLVGNKIFEENLKVGPKWPKSE